MKSENPRFDRLGVKRRFVVACLLAMVAWIPVHVVLVERFQLNPWKFCGFAMYATPRPQIHVAFYTEDDAVLTPLAVELPTPEDRRAFVQYLGARRHAGLWLPPEELAQRIFRLQPAVDSLAIVVSRTVLDRETARGVTTHRGYHYRRPAP